MKEFLQRILQDVMKKKMLGTSDAWPMSHSSHRSSVLYWRLAVFRFNSTTKYFTTEDELGIGTLWREFSKSSDHDSNLEIESKNEDWAGFIKVIFNFFLGRLFPYHRIQTYSRLRCLVCVKGLVICFYLGWSGSIQQILSNIAHKWSWLSSIQLTTKFNSISSSFFTLLPSFCM